MPRTPEILDINVISALTTAQLLYKIYRCRSLIDYLNQELANEVLKRTVDSPVAKCLTRHLHRVFTHSKQYADLLNTRLIA